MRRYVRSMVAPRAGACCDADGHHRRYGDRPRRGDDDACRCAHRGRSDCLDRERRRHRGRRGDRCVRPLRHARVHRHSHARVQPSSLRHEPRRRRSRGRAAGRRLPRRRRFGRSDHHRRVPSHRACDAAHARLRARQRRLTRPAAPRRWALLEAGARVARRHRACGRATSGLGARHQSAGLGFAHRHVRHRSGQESRARRPISPTCR